LNKRLHDYYFTALLLLCLLGGCAKHHPWDGRSITYCEYTLHEKEIQTEKTLSKPHELEVKTEKLLHEHKLQEAIWLLDSHLETVGKAEALKKKLRHILLTGHFTIVPKVLGGTNPKYFLEFDEGVKAVFKIDNANVNFVNSNSEIAAYELDDILKFGVVPMTLKRTIELKDHPGGTEGSVQYYLSDMTPGQPQHVTAANFVALKIFDFIIGNIDRKHENFLLWEGENRVIAIDNGGSFQKNSCGTLGEMKHYFSQGSPLDEHLKHVDPREVKTRLSRLVPQEALAIVIQRITDLKEWKR
jgi:hypothetical protein